jgi:UDP-N-acetylglucosamine transferase subunit ALG13
VEDLGSRLPERRIWGADLLILATVGNTEQGFDRLMRAVEEMISSVPNHEDVFIQYGNSRVVPSNCRAVAFVSRDEFDQLILQASLVITHGGAGSIGKCLLSGKRPVVVPRRKAFGEHVNDHQLELVRELESQGRIYAVYDIACLPGAVREARERGATQPLASSESGVSVLVKKFLDRLSSGKNVKR